MDYIRQYKSFINSHYFSEGLRMTIGILIPAFVMSFFGVLPYGIIMCLGAVCVSIADNPGPVHHRKNGMTACILAVFVVALLTNLVNTSNIATGVFLLIASLFFSMLGVYGTRPTGIGIASLLTLILTIDPTVQTKMPVILHVLLLVAGGLWYMCFSLLLYNFRPFRLPQQSLGEYVQIIASYLRTRAMLYNDYKTYNETFRQLLIQQAIVQEKQNTVGELLLKTQAIVKESTPVGRILLATFMEVSDLFEKIITSFLRYSEVHKLLGDTGILSDFSALITKAANELEDVGIAIKSGQKPAQNEDLENELAALKKRFDVIQAKRSDASNIELFIGLRRTIHNIEDIISRLNIIQEYLTKDLRHKMPKSINIQAEADDFLHHQPIEFSELLDNLSLKSDVFRHSLRLTTALLLGFVVAIVFSIGHGYWILLTILVILKPAYSLTKKRNRDRIIGTVAGALIGLGILQFVHNETALLCLMVLFMVANYSFMRTNYMISVMLMTPYILLFFHLLQPNNFNALLKDRLIDTAIGSVIAFAASVLLFPAWEKHKILPLMVTGAESLKQYFCAITRGLIETIKPSQQRTARKNAFVALANVSDAFNRMISEPKFQQQHTEEIQRFVVLLHMLLSYIATLSYYTKGEKSFTPSEQLKHAIDEIEQVLDDAILYLQKQEKVEALNQDIQALQPLHDYANELRGIREQELANGMEESITKTRFFEAKSIAHQFKLIYRSATEIRKLSSTIKLSE
jgi:uncharacterized membrane protein (TIGR01666 family)